MSQLVRGFRSSAVCRGLDDFFVSFPELDNQKNPIYPAVGRSWRTDELRQKSFDDLHKLWWVLLKERNSLAIERHSARAKGAMIINPSRIRKVRLSMNRIRVVLGERKRMLGLLKRQEEARAAAENPAEEEPAFEYPPSLLAHPFVAAQKPRRGAQRKRWRKFVGKEAFHRRAGSAAQHLKPA